MARLTPEQLRDKARYKFDDQVVDLPELGGDMLVKALTIAERDALPELVEDTGKTDGDGNPILKPVATPEKLAATLAQVVADPRMTAEEWGGIIRDLPATAVDKTIAAFGELLGGKEERQEAVKEFRPSTD